MIRLASAAALAFALAACGPGSSAGGPTINNKMGGGELEYRSPVVSWDILEREPIANEVQVKHILIGWKDLEEAYGGRMAPAAAQRTRKEAEDEIRSLLGQLNAGADFTTLMRQHSEDSGSAQSDSPVITVTPDPPLAIEFRQLSLRLKPGEIGVCQTDFGFHIIRRE